MLHIDFWFEDLRGQLIVIGWSDVAGVQMRLNEQPLYARTPRMIDRYSRADLGSSAPMGFLAIFAGTGKAALSDDLTEVAVEADGHAKLLMPQGKGFRALAEVGVKEAYDRALLALAAGEVAIEIDAGCAAIIKIRMVNYPVGTTESIQFAVSVDNALAAYDGSALLTGWFLAHRKYSACALHGFTLSNTAMSQVKVLRGQVHRPDLEPFSARYNFTGHDGFVASTLQSDIGRDTGQAQVFLAVDLGATTAIVQVPTQNAAPQSIGRMLATTQQSLTRADQRNAFLEGFLGGRRASDDFAALAGSFTTPQSGSSALIVDLDVDGEFCADLCLAFATDKLAVDHVVLLVDPGDSAALRAIDRTRAELTEIAGSFQISARERGRLGACLNDLQHLGCAKVVFGRASVLFHLLERDTALLSAAMVATEAMQVVFSRRAQDAGLVEAEVSAGYQPIVLVAPLDALQSALARVPQVFMTEEAILKYTAARLPACFTSRLAALDGLLLGQSGQHNHLLVWGQNAYTVDSTALGVMARTGSFA